MIDSIIAAGAAILVCLINNFYMDKRRQEKADTDLEVLRATITAEIQNLKKSVDKHNQVIDRVYALESRADVLDEKVKVANHRLDDLEQEAR